MAAHPKLVNVNILTWGLLLEDTEKAQKLAEELGLVPNHSTPPPIHCGKPMKVTKRPDQAKFGWVWFVPRSRIKLDRWSGKRKGAKRLLIRQLTLGLKIISWQYTTV